MGLGGRGRVGTLIAALVALSLAFAAPATAKTGVTSVVGGQPASIAQFPFMARIVAREGSLAYTCSGTVVSPNLILTAAHCLMDESGTHFLPPASFEVLTGTSSLAVPGVVSRAERLVIDPSYIDSGSFGGWHDAGLIQLTAPIGAPAVKVATSERWGPGTGGVVVGWGLTAPKGSLPAEMQAGETVVQSTAYCQGAIGARFHPLAEICTIDYPTYQSATCNGDSGGPLLMISSQELIQIGITSFGIEEGCPTTSPRVDTRVDVEAAWVQREIAAHPPVSPLTPAPTPTRAVPVRDSPAPELPELTPSQAKHNVFNVVRSDRKLAPRFRVHSGYRVACRSKGRTSASCTVSWYGRPNDYWGNVTIFEEWEGSTPVWSYRYTIRSVNAYCYWYSGHRGRCPTGRFQVR